MIASGKGALAAAVHLKIVVPTEVAGSFKQIVGTLHGSPLRGNLRFESVAAGVTLEQVYSVLVARTGGGALTVRTFRGDRIELESGTGDMEIEDMQAKVSEWIAKTPPGEWVVGSGWFTFGGRSPTKHDLDPVSPNHPVMLIYQGGHMAVAF